MPTLLAFLDDGSPNLELLDSYFYCLSMCLWHMIETNQHPESLVQWFPTVLMGYVLETTEEENLAYNVIECLNQFVLVGTVRGRLLPVYERTLEQENYFLDLLQNSTQKTGNLMHKKLSFLTTLFSLGHEPVFKFFVANFLLIDQLGIVLREPSLQLKAVSCVQTFVANCLQGPIWWQLLTKLDFFEHARNILSTGNFL